MFITLYHFFEKRRAAFFVVLVGSFLGVGYFAFQIKREEDISKVIPRDAKMETFSEVFQNSKFAEKLVIMVSAKDTNALANPNALVAFADDFARQTDQKLKPYIGKTNYKIDDNLALEMFGSINQHLPVYLEESDYQIIDTLIAPATVRQTLQNNYRTLGSPAGIVLKQMITQDPVGVSLLGLKKLQQLQYDENFELYEGYVISKDHKHLLLFLTPAYAANNTGQNELLLKGLDGIIDSLDHNHAATARYFGATAVAVGNALQIRRDARLTQGTMVVFLVVFLGWYFGKKRAPLLVLLPVVFGALFSMTALYFIKGQVSVIALATGSVVLGIAVNYSLHVFNHFRHVGDIRLVIKDLSIPMTIGSFTTIGGFLCLQLAQSELLRDLGLYAAFALIGAVLASLIFLPHLIAAPTFAAREQAGLAQKSWIDRLAAYRFEQNKPLIVAILLLTGVFWYATRWVGFESDMMNMNFMSSSLKEAETELNQINAYALQSVYVVSKGKTLEAALRENEKTAAVVAALQSRAVVQKYVSVSGLLVSDSLQKVRIKRWNAYWTLPKKQKLLATLAQEGQAAGFKMAAFGPFEVLLNTNFQPTDSATVAQIRHTFFDDYITQQPHQTTVVMLLKANRLETPAVYAALANRPNVGVIDKQYFTNRLVEVINADFSRIAWLTSLLVLAVLLLTYGRIELALVSFIPMLITWVWILGIMGIFKIQFNIVNVIISALIFGLGDDYSLFIMDGLLQEYKTGKKNLASYKSSILLSGITTVAGLGALIFAKHPALHSIALISIVGIVCVMAISQIMIPFLFDLIIKKRTLQKLFPWTLYNFIASLIGFTFFVLGCFLLTPIGIVLTKLNPFDREKSKLLFHVILSKFVWAQIYAMPNIKKNIVNPLGENFAKPVLVIANHQSVLDILLLLMLRPKMILLTNNWVWHSPFFGYIARMADFYRVDDGAQGSLDMLAEKVKMGYSLVVFPEGTRSTDGALKRFHKGAFFLAEKLQLDILPVLLHGTGYTLRKGQFMATDGTITVQFLPRISPQNTTWGHGYAERTKNIGQYFKTQYETLKRERERTGFWRETLIYNYLYKGPVLEWYMKIKTKMEGNYQLFDELIPPKAKILDIGCGYGFMSYMLHLAAPQRVVLGIDYDEEKIATAQHCFSKNAHVNFEYTDVLTHHFDQYDTIILSDVLHYLQPHEQQFVLEKCIKSLRAGGSLLVRDGNKDLEERHKGTKLSEFFSTKLVGFNKTTNKGLSFLSASSVKKLAEQHGFSCQEIDNTKYTSNVILVLRNNK